MATEPQDLQCYYDAALQLAREAGEVARGALCRDMQVAEKECSSDLVTETDKKVEEMILSTLRKKFPSHQFIGEESVGDVCTELTDDPTWMVDPIDGTTNFVHGFPYAAISIGLVIDKEPVVGVVYNFILDQLFAAVKGGGATMNDKPIHVSTCEEVSKAMLLAELGGVRPEHILRLKMDTIFDIAVEPNQAHGMRSIGSAALSMCMVAQGCVDAYFEYGVHCWDIAAGVIIVREAGGTCVHPTDKPLDVMERGVMAAGTQALTKQLCPRIKFVGYKKD